MVYPLLFMVNIIDHNFLKAKYLTNVLKLSGDWDITQYQPVINVTHQKNKYKIKLFELK